jgi:signal transduction protein with GAF and PtsI domain
MPPVVTIDRSDLRSPVVDAVLEATAAELGTELVALGGFTADEFVVLRLIGGMPGVAEGMAFQRSSTLAHALVCGAPAVTNDAAHIPAYADLPGVAERGVCTAVGAPIEVAGRVVGLLCGTDRTAKPVDDRHRRTLAGYAGVLAAHLQDSRSADVVLRRTPDGWRVGAADGLDVTTAMVLADLLAESDSACGRPPRTDPGELSETERLRTQVRQLEHALTARVVVEQAIGVLAERQRLSTRAAFERLRRAARTRGRRVADIAREVVASSADSAVPLPPELAPRR